jgi:CRP-like cAMP-binding protein
MKIISNKNLLDQYYTKYEVEKLFDADMRNHAKLLFYEKYELVLRSEEELTNYLLLVEGKVRISYPFENGKSMLLKFYKPFNTIGDLELLKNMPVRCDVEAITDTYFIALPIGIIKRNYMNNINFLHHLIDSLSNKLHATINNNSYNYVYPLVNRLSSYLVEQLTEPQKNIILNESLKDISQFLGTTYRHLNRTLHELEALAIIRCEEKTIHILDEEKLRVLAKNCYLATF